MEERGSAATAPKSATDYHRLRPGPGRSPAAVEADQRRRIERALAEIAAEVGYRTATVRRVARLAGVSTETLYELYRGKDDLLISAYTSFMARCRSRIERSRSPALGPRAQLRPLLVGQLEELATDSAAAHLALVEVFDGGASALARVRIEEGALRAALGGCLERRERRIPPLLIGWIASGWLHAARRSLAQGGPSPRCSEAALSWSKAVLDPGLPDLSGKGGALGNDPLDPPGIGSGGEGVDADFAYGAVVKLARKEGFRGLSVVGVSTAAGISASSFRRRFGTVERCVVGALRALAERYFSGLPTAPGSRSDWATSTHRAIELLCRTVAADPALAELCFARVLEPGVAGLRCRDVLIRRFAERWRAAAPARDRPTALAAESTVAALWSAVAEFAEAGAGRLPAEADTLALLALAPTLGVDPQRGYETSPPTPWRPAPA